MDVLAFVKAILADLSCSEFKASGRSIAALSRAHPPTAGSLYSLRFTHRHAVPRSGGVWLFIATQRDRASFLATYRVRVFAAPATDHSVIHSDYPTRYSSAFAGRLRRNRHSVVSLLAALARRSRHFWEKLAQACRADMEFACLGGADPSAVSWRCITSP